MPRLLIALLLLMFVSGCSEPPQKEIDQAQSAIDAARAAGADQYAAEDYTGAVTALQKSHTAIDQRDYRQALSYAIDARQRANDASKQIADGRARARKAAETLIKDDTSRADRLQTLLQNAADAHAAVKQLRGPRATLAQAHTALQEARTACAAGNYLECSARLDGVREKLDAGIKAVQSIPLHPRVRRTKGRRPPSPRLRRDR